MGAPTIVADSAAIPATINSNTDMSKPIILRQSASMPPAAAPINNAGETNPPTKPKLLAISTATIFDISKIGPVGHAENFTGGIGVMADDLVAGILAAVVLWVGAISMGYAL